MYNVVHIDEKCCDGSSEIDRDGNEIFSGKIGIFPFIKREAAQRRSCNRDAGTMEIKSITSVTREIIRSVLINEVIPSIKLKWPPSCVGEIIYIQQDNARTHVDPMDQDFRAAALSSGFDIRLVCQPPNSPDLNILDLGFFNAIQSLQRKSCAKKFEELVLVVQQAFADYPPRKVNLVFLTLKLCMKEIIKIGGSNRYKIPHIGKGRLERIGCLPQQISVEPTLVESVVNFLSAS
ncbi:hypothetical protein LIER_10521 [Lithospermum erythrorhizon]|uniref:Transposase n=1 Tax=Lithospermum erythrorhizon TaxID=34254 RepID=A0AAV3PJM2_LITER